MGEARSTAGLSRAQREIADTYIELCSTLETVNELAREGEPERALLLVEKQREALDGFVRRIAYEVGCLPVRRQASRVSALLGASVAAAATVVGFVVSRVIGIPHRKA